MHVFMKQTSFYCVFLEASVSTNCDRDFLYDWVWCYMKIGGCMNVGKIIM